MLRNYLYLCGILIYCSGITELIPTRNPSLTEDKWFELTMTCINSCFADVMDNLEHHRREAIGSDVILYEVLDHLSSSIYRNKENFNTRLFKDVKRKNLESENEISTTYMRKISRHLNMELKDFFIKKEYDKIQIFHCLDKLRTFFPRNERPYNININEPRTMFGKLRVLLSMKQKIDREIWEQNENLQRSFLEEEEVDGFNEITTEFEHGLSPNIKPDSKLINTQCTICLCKFTNQETILTSCGHKFCKECLTKLKKQTTATPHRCPNCRTIL